MVLLLAYGLFHVAGLVPARFMMNGACTAQEHVLGRDGEGPELPLVAYATLAIEVK